MERIPFGRTGHPSSRVIFGAAALGGGSQAFADRVLAQVTAAGVNHIDTAAGYGLSELRLAPFLAEHRHDVFLATKTGERTGPAARRQLEASLERMGVGHVDLIQLHNLVEEDEWATAFGPGGALEALQRAREEGLVRWIGVTGHGLRIPRMHLRSLERADLDSVLFPWSPVLARIGSYAEDVRELMDRCLERGVAMQTIKAVARSRWMDPSAPHRSWYEPITDPAAIARAVRFVLSHPGVFLNSSSDATLLGDILAAADGPGALTRPAPAELEADIADLGVTPLFDGASLERI